MLECVIKEASRMHKRGKKRQRGLGCNPLIRLLLMRTQPLLYFVSFIHFSTKIIPYTRRQFRTRSHCIATTGGHPAALCLSHPWSARHPFLGAHHPCSRMLPYRVRIIHSHLLRYTCIYIYIYIYIKRDM